MNAGDVPGAGEFELQEVAGDVWRAYFHSMGIGVYGMAIAAVAGTSGVVLALAHGEVPSVLPVVLFLCAGVFIWGVAKRAKAGQKYTVRLTPSHIEIVQASMSLRVGWESITQVLERGGILSARSPAAVIVLPWYRLTSIQRDAVLSHLTRFAPQAPVKKRAAGSGKLVLLWVALVIFFVVLYNLVGTR